MTLRACRVPSKGRTFRDDIKWPKFSILTRERVTYFFCTVRSNHGSSKTQKLLSGGNLSGSIALLLDLLSIYGGNTIDINKWFSAGVFNIVDRMWWDVGHFSFADLERIVFAD